MLNQLLDSLYPRICVLCGSSETTDKDICHSCLSDLVINDSSCTQCAVPLPFVTESQVCGNCLKNKPYFDASWSAFVYAQPLEWMIQQLKFNAKLSYANLLSNLALSHLPEMGEQPDCIIPIPLHNKRLKQRGFNQALELLKPIANSLKIKIDNQSCQRLTHTSSQTGLKAKLRQKNIKNAFSYKNKNKYQYVILFDDVVTTGSTTNELARTLKREGVKRVDVWSLARAAKPG